MSYVQEYLHNIGPVNETNPSWDCKVISILNTKIWHYNKFNPLIFCQQQVRIADNYRNFVSSEHKKPDILQTGGLGGGFGTSMVTEWETFCQ